MGLIQIYTGDGKGKTTAAIGLAVRAAGRGLTCHIIHFMKGDGVSGEDLALTDIEGITVNSVGKNLIGANPPSVREVKESLEPALDEARDAVSGRFDLVVLDEIIVACSMGLVSEHEIMTIIGMKAERTELVMTGRGVTDNLIKTADLVTEMREVKHPFSDGGQARKGIEF
ncbi:MAG TPA: cob(I)yrinic acid a,c-diamide adenosyltransferase [Actinobacteria bacterium]|nr:cob(I)yrinic acid a,c-diamide adenosyltransferase [Actinomycetota bacterium]